jgi:hypothetical protein
MPKKATPAFDPEDEELLPGEAQATAEDPPVEEAAPEAPATAPVFGKPQGEGYESRNPNFTAGGTAYVRAYCPLCESAAFFSVDVGVQFTTTDEGGAKIKPTFAVKAKEHTCHQAVLSESAFLEEEPAPEAAPAETLACPCSECVPACDNPPDGTDRCASCHAGEHMEEPEEG